MNDAALLVSIPVIGTLAAAISAYAAARYAGRTSLAIAQTTTTTEKQEAEHQRFQDERAAFREEIREELGRLRDDRDALQARVHAMETELRETRQANIKLEQDRERLTRQVSDLQAEVRWLKAHTNGDDD